MSITMKDVRAQLDRDEPDYKEAAMLGQDAIPYLSELVKGPDAMLASKAAYLASLIKSELYCRFGRGRKQSRTSSPNSSCFRHP